MVHQQALQLTLFLGHCKHEEMDGLHELVAMLIAWGKKLCIGSYSKAKLRWMN